MRIKNNYFNSLFFIMSIKSKATINIRGGLLKQKITTPVFSSTQIVSNRLPSLPLDQEILNKLNYFFSSQGDKINLNNKSIILSFVLSNVNNKSFNIDNYLTSILTDGTSLSTIKSVVNKDIRKKYNLSESELSSQSLEIGFCPCIFCKSQETIRIKTRQTRASDEQIDIRVECKSCHKKFTLK